MKPLRSFPVTCSCELSPKLPFFPFNPQYHYRHHCCHQQSWPNSSSSCLVLSTHFLSSFARSCLMDSDILRDIFQTPCPTPLPGSETQDAEATLALQDINYRVKYRTGPWWQGACFRHKQVKHVLCDVTLALPAGQLIGLVGSSGKSRYLSPNFTFQLV